MKTRYLLAALCALTLINPAAGWAQSPASGARERGTQVAGTVQRLEGRTLTIATAQNESVALLLPEGLRIIRSRRVELTDLRPGEFIASGAITGADGRLRAQEVRIFPEALRGTGEGHHAISGGPGASMTNATVATVSQAAQAVRTMTNATVAAIGTANAGRVLRVQYKGGQQDIEVSPATPVTRQEMVGPEALVAGARVSASVEKTAQGLTASRVNISAD